MTNLKVDEWKIMFAKELTNLTPLSNEQAFQIANESVFEYYYTSYTEPMDAAFKEYGYWCN